MTIPRRRSTTTEYRGCLPDRHFRAVEGPGLALTISLGYEFNISGMLLAPVTERPFALPPIRQESAFSEAPGSPNHLLASLSNADFEVLRPFLQGVELKHETLLAKAGDSRRCGGCRAFDFRRSEPLLSVAFLTTSSLIVDLWIVVSITFHERSTDAQSRAERADAANALNGIRQRNVYRWAAQMLLDAAWLRRRERVSTKARG